MFCHHENKIDTKDLREQNLNNRLIFYQRAHTILRIKKEQLLQSDLHRDDTPLFEKHERDHQVYRVFRPMLP